MLAKSILSTEIQTLSPDDTGLTALSLMDDYKLSHLPLVCNNEFLGLISEGDVMQFADIDDTINNQHVVANRIFINESQHILDVFRLVAANKLTLIAVINDKNQYIGSITLQQLMLSFSAIDPIKDSGGIIVLQINLRDYNLVEIAGIVESNDTKIMGLYTHSEEDSMKLEVTVKMNSLDISAVINTFNRYNYTIKASFGQNDLDDLLRDRYEALMTYLSV